MSLVIFYDSFNAFERLTPRDFFNIVIFTPVSIAVVFSYVFNKNKIDRKYWRALFWIAIIDEILYAIYKSDNSNQILAIFYKSNLYMPSYDSPVIVSIFLIIFILLPFYYAFYRLGYPKKPKPGIDWIILITEKYSESLRFYKEILGFKVKRETPEDEFCEFSVDGRKFALFGKKQIVKMLGKKYIGKPASAIYTFPESHDVDKQYEDLKAKGVKFIKKPETQPWGQRTAYFTDPDGHIWEIQQWIKSN